MLVNNSIIQKDMNKWKCSCYVLLWVSLLFLKVTLDISLVRSLKISLCNLSCPAGLNVNTVYMLLNIWLYH